MKIKILIVSVVAVLLAIIIGKIVMLSNSDTDVNTSDVIKKDDINIVIDAGHGGFDGGAVAYDKSSEKDINLEIALKLRDVFIVSGFNVVMTREEDVSTDNNGVGKSSKKKDMYKRLKVLNEDSDNIFISIHQNKFSDPRVSGAQVFYGGNNKYSKGIAKSIQGSINDVLQPKKHKVEVKAKKDLFLLYKAKVPAVLIECGFISNKDELVKLKDEEYQNKIAMTILGGVLNFLNS